MLDELDYQANTGSDSDSDDEEEEHEEVPISLALLIIVGFFYGGNYFFHRSEDWSMGQSFYFNVITLSSVVSELFIEL